MGSLKGVFRGLGRDLFEIDLVGMQGQYRVIIGN